MTWSCSVKFKSPVELSIVSSDSVVGFVEVTVSKGSVVVDVNDDNSNSVDGETDVDGAFDVLEKDSVVVEHSVFGTVSHSQAFLSNQLKIALK